MFIIKHNDKKVGNKSFSSYEEARSYARKLIRRYLRMLNLVAHMADRGGINQRNPSINMYGYTVVAR
jgi:hypothetical protein